MSNPIVKIPGDYNEGSRISILQIPDGGYSQAAIIHNFRDAHAQDITGLGVKIGILDTGDVDHQDSIPAEKMLFADVYQDGIDKVGHGTQVKGIGSMKPSNDIGYIGAAHGATFYTHKVLSIDGGSSASLAQGIRELTDEGCDIINMSLGIEGVQEDAVVDAALEYADAKGVILLAAAGNSSRGGLSYPASNNLVIAGKAVDINLKHASFSNLSGIGDHDNCFAGVGVRVPTIHRDGGYSSPSGTSVAIPFISNVLACFVQMFRGYFLRKPTRIEAIKYLKATALDIEDDGPDRKTGYGLARIIVMSKQDLEKILDLEEKNVCAELTTSEAVAVENMRSPKNFWHRIASRLLLT